jgi:hypothetical protein
MYRKPDQEAEFEKFDMVFGGMLNKNNRWVILADLILWNEVEKKYSKLLRITHDQPLSM